MDWLEFIAQMTSAVAWPLVAFIALILLRTQIRSAADSLVARIGEITRLKSPGVDIEFAKQVEELAERTEVVLKGEAQPLSPAETVAPSITGEPPSGRYEQYEYLTFVDPRAAILVSFSDLELLVKAEFERRYPKSKSWISFSRMIQQLFKDGLMDEDIYASLRELADLRNQVAHKTMEIKTETAQHYVEAIQNVKIWFLLMPLFESGDSEPENISDD